MSDTRAAQPWRAPDVSGTVANPTLARPVSVGSLQDLQQEAYREAYAQGMKEGIAAGHEQVRQQVERFAAMLHDLARPFEQLDAQVEQELLALSTALARQIVRRELRADPSHVIGIIRDAIKALPVTMRDVRVYLHPEDAQVVRSLLAPTESERAWQIVEDPVMTRGGCQVVSASSRVDGRLETRLTAMLAELMGGGADNRASDDPGAGAGLPK
jgi:flagellar assembly protein FliH